MTGQEQTTTFLDPASVSSDPEIEQVVQHTTIEKRFHTYTSVDGKTIIRAVFWLNESICNGQPPKAVIQLIHGMGEHIGRYERFARFLAACGFLVCGNDHVGHGKTAVTPDDFGILPGKDPVGVMVDDVHLLREAVQQNLPHEFPHAEHMAYFMFGHSMGSLILRCYLPKYGQGLTGAVICGTTMPNRLLSGLGVLLSKGLIMIKGPTSKSKFLHHVAYGVYSKRIKNARTEFDWISSDPDEVDAFINDSATGFTFSAAVYLALTEAAFDSACPAAFKGVPNDLPLLLIAGDCDPVGDDGKMVEAVVGRMRKAGVESVTLKLYGGMRHEILNEVGKVEVFKDIIAWIEETVIEDAEQHQKAL